MSPTDTPPDFRARAAAPSVSLFYPMHNERGSVESITAKALNVLSATCADFEIIIVDDGSTDGSGRIADQLASAHDRVRVVRHPHNRGYGQALRTGLASATKDVVAYTDCDEPADLWLLPAALAHLANHDLVIGYRLSRDEGARRLVYSAVYNALVRLLFAVSFRDINFSFKLIRREALARMTLGSSSVFIDGELLVTAARQRLRVFEMPVEYQPRRHGEAHFGSLRSATSALRELLAYRLRR